MILNKKLTAVLFLFFIVGFSNAGAQTNVYLQSVTPNSGSEGTAIVLGGTNLLNCSPLNNPACNVQFFDSDVRRSTVSGTEQSNGTVKATVPLLCPGKYTIRVGEVLDRSNDIPFTYLNVSSQATADDSSFYCRYISSITPTSGEGGTTFTLTGSNLHASVYFYNSSGTIVANATGTVKSTYPVDLGGGNMQNWISELEVTVPESLAGATYGVRVGTNRLVSVNTTNPVQVPDISNSVDFRVISTVTLPPQISNVKAINITANSATIIWNTDKPADSQVEFCRSAIRCFINTPLDKTMVTSHSVNLTGLLSNTYYYFWVKSRDSSGKLNTLGYFLFRTSSSATPTPAPTISSTPYPTPTPITKDKKGPVISNIRVFNIDRFSATVTWTTDEPSDSQVMSCILSVFCFGSIGSDATRTTSHVINLTNLQAGKTYYIQVASTDADWNRTTSEIFSFKTVVGLVISNIRAENITNSSFDIVWDTNYPADSRAVYCYVTFFCYFMSPLKDTNLTTSHRIQATGLRSNTLYYYQVISTEALGYSARSFYNTTRTK